MPEIFPAAFDGLGARSCAPLPPLLQVVYSPHLGPGQFDLFGVRRGGIFCIGSHRRSDAGPGVFATRIHRGLLVVWSVLDWSGALELIHTPHHHVTAFAIRHIRS